MKKSTPFYFLIFSILILSCIHEKKKSTTAIRNPKPTATTGEDISNPKPIVNIAVDTTKILLVNTYLHAFSDPTKPDTFKMVMRGKSITSGKINFDIISFKNVKIYSETMNADDLLGDLDALNERQKEDTIKKRFNDFFRADAFSVPALGHNIDPADTDYVDIKTQRDISSDPNDIGFTFAIGYESIEEIAYSKRYGKTVVCFASD